jgi:FkbM family methyltransferase
VVVPYDEGRSKIIADLGTALGLGLYRYGYRDRLIDLVRRLLKPGDIFVDGGANIGLFTLAAAARVGPYGRVIAFEPGNWAFDALRANVSLNRFGWVDVYKTALADAPGQAEFTSFAGDAAAWSSLAKERSLAVDHHFHCDKEIVPLAPLDQFVSSALQPRLTLIKLDLEGAEHRALVGSSAILAYPGPDLLIEVDTYNLGRQGASVEGLMTLLSRSGYRLFSIKSKSDNQESTATLHEITGALLDCTALNLFGSKDPLRVSKAGLNIKYI